MPNPPDSFFTAQERQLSLFVEGYLLEYIDLLEAARKELELAISGPESFAQTQAIELLPQVDRIAAQVKQQIRAKRSLLDAITPIAEQHAIETVAAITGRELAISFNTLNAQVLDKFAANTLSKVTGFVDTEVAFMKGVLFQNVGVKGVNPRQVAKALAGEDSRFAGRFNHVQTIMRTESSTIYNAQAKDGIRQANQFLGPDQQLKKRIVETLDANRNHPISRVLNGQVREWDKPFSASVADIRRAAAAIKKKPQLSAIFWTLKDGVYYGDKLPAHYNERGIVVASE